MARKPTGRPNGRPRKEIDVQTFKNLCAIFCTLEEIAGVFECSTDTVERWCERELGDTFAEVYKKESGRGKASLRRTQLKIAQKNAGMAIFLGKQYLGQSDHVEIVDTAALDKLDDILAQTKENATNAIQRETE